MKKRVYNIITQLTHLAKKTAQTINTIVHSRILYKKKKQVYNRNQLHVEVAKILPMYKTILIVNK